MSFVRMPERGDRAPIVSIAAEYGSPREDDGAGDTLMPWLGWLHAVSFVRMPERGDRHFTGILFGGRSFTKRSEPL